MSVADTAFAQTVALVTGASRGIGRATASALAEAGAIVHICARSADALADLASAHPERIFAHTVDICDEVAVSEMIESIAATHRRLDLLINNASILGPKGPLATLDVAEFRRTLEINVHGTFVVTRAAIPLMLKAPTARAIHLSSSVGRAPRANWGAYCVSKFGVEALSGILAQEGADDGIVSVTLNPGGTATEMRAEAYPDEDPDTLPTPERVAETILLVAARVGPDQSGRMYTSRDLFDLLDEPPSDPEDLPAQTW